MSLDDIMVILWMNFREVPLFCRQSLNLWLFSFPFLFSFFLLLFGVWTWVCSFRFWFLIASTKFAPYLCRGLWANVISMVRALYLFSFEWFISNSYWSAHIEHETKKIKIKLNTQSPYKLIISKCNIFITKGNKPYSYISTQSIKPKTFNPIFLCQT